MKWSVCIDNTGYAASLEARKLYLTVDDHKAETLGLVRVIDESGESYLYPQALFLPMDISHPVEAQLLAASAH